MKNTLQDNSYTNNLIREEIDFLDFLSFLNTKKIKILIVSASSCLLFFLFSFLIIPKFESTVLIMPNEEKSNLDSIVNRYGGLASVAGISLNQGEINKSDYALQVLSSNIFLNKFFEDRNLMPLLLGTRKWEESNNTIIYDQNKYNPLKNEWVWKRKNRYGKPTILESMKYWQDKVFSIETNKLQGFHRVKIRHVSPFIAKDIATWLISDLNDAIRAIDVNEADLSIEYLSLESKNTSSEELRSLFFELISEKTKIKMLAFANRDYIFKVIDPAFVSEEPVIPNRTLMSMIGFFIGLTAGLISFLFIYILRIRKS